MHLRTQSCGSRWLLLLSGVTDCLESYTEKVEVLCSFQEDLKITVNLCQW